MEPNPGENLRASVTAILGKGTCSAPELIDVLRQTRLLIEHKGLRPDHRVAALYCDWIQHNELDRAEAGFDVLEKLNDALITHGDGDYSGIFNAISDALGLRALRRELRTIFNLEGISTSLFDYSSNWGVFVGTVLTDIEQRPIRFPDDITSNPKARGRTFYDRMVSKPSGWPENRVPLAIYFTKHRSGQDQLGPYPGYYWHIRLAPGPNFLEVKGPLNLTERSEDFLPASQ